MHRLKSSNTWPFRLLFISLAIILGACGRATDTPTPTPTITPIVSPTPFPTRTPTPYPLASSENPLVLGIVSETNDPQAATAAEELAQILARITNYHIRSQTYLKYADVLSDLQAGKVHIVFLQPFTYLWARGKGLVIPAFLTNHFGVYQYGGQFLANVKSNFIIYFDPVKGLNTTNAGVALKQFENTRPCWVDKTSASGYVVPLGLLAEQGISVKEGVITQSHTSVVRALYVNGICDFGATFATTGDPRTASAITQDLTDVMNRVVIIYQIDPIIPNLNISFHANVPKIMRDDLTFALQSLVKDQKQLFSTANNYEISDLKPVDDTVYDPLRNYLLYSDVKLDTLIGR
jgi:phosphonate transport system substrate-binding protein